MGCGHVGLFTCTFSGLIHALGQMAETVLVLLQCPQLIFEGDSAVIHLVVRPRDSWTLLERKRVFTFSQSIYRVGCICKA